MVKRYKHYKGAIYELICIAVHSETGEKLVIYKNEDGTSFARPFEMFFEEVKVEGKTIPRFQKI